MRKLWIFLLALSLCVPTLADEADLTRFEKVLEYLKDTSKAEPSTESLMVAAQTAIADREDKGLSVQTLLQQANDGGKLHKKVIAAVLESLNDPWARIYTPEEVAEVRGRLDGGRKGALGITVVKIEEPASYRIVGVSPQSPAEGHLVPGDTILEANGVQPQSAEFSDQIAGDAGKEVTLKILSENGQTRLETLTLSDFESQTAYLADPAIGLIRVTSFGDHTAQELAAALAELEGRPAIIDLRFNGGGYVNAAVASSDLFLGAGDNVVTTVSSKETVVHQASHPIEFTQPVCILVNSRTASAAEIFAAALHEHVGAYVVGDRTYGKGSVQRLVSLPGDWGLKYTTSLYQTPDGVFIDKIGITPDRAVEMPAHLTASAADTQLAAALTWTKQQPVAKR